MNGFWENDSGVCKPYHNIIMFWKITLICYLSLPLCLYFFNSDLDNVSDNQEPEQEVMEIDTFNGKDIPAPGTCVFLEDILE